MTQLYIMVTLVLGTVHFLRGRGGGLVKLGEGGHAKKRLKRGAIPKKNGGKGESREIF